MNEAVTDRLYSLLPAVYRIRDAENGQVLRALFRVLENELAALEQDIESLYDNWFVETCDEWAVPYLGDLLQVPGLHSGGVGSFSLRAYVANTLAYRRRKGTATVLEQVAGDVSGWRARVVEFGRLLAASQNLNHVRRAPAAFTSVRNADALALLNGPFDPAAHGPDVRHASSARGRYNLPHVGIFLWRLQSYEIERGTAPALGHGRYTFHPLGLSVPLFNNPQPETEITHLAEEVNVPAPLRRRPLFRELEARRAALAAGATPAPVYFGTQPPFAIYLDGAEQPLAPEVMRICDLSAWDGWSAPPQDADAAIAAHVDPQLGRLALPDGVSASRVEVSYAFGFSADVGGGPYNRNESLAGVLGDATTIWWRGVSAASGTDDGPVYPTLAQAVQAWRTWNSAHAQQIGVITILDSATYTETLTGEERRIDLAATNRLIIVAAAWRSGDPPSADDPEVNVDELAVPGGDLTRLLVAEGVRPCVRGNVSTKAAAGARLHLNGLLLDGTLSVLAGDLESLELVHCTVVPVSGRLAVTSASGGANAHLTVRVDHSICGRVTAPEALRELRVADSIIDAREASGALGYAVAGRTDGSEPGPPTTIERCTVHGRVRVTTLTLASETLFTAPAQAERLQEGCVRYCYLPENSHVPRRFRCQPDLALLARARALSAHPELATAADLPASERARIVAHLRPMFTSLDYGDPGYMQLARACAAELRAGAEDGSELGVFSHLRQPQREANIRQSLNEYLRFGLEAGLFFVT